MTAVDISIHASFLPHNDPDAEHPHGVRDCAFRDPAGNLIRIQELRSSRPAIAAEVKRLGLVQRTEVLRNG